MCQFFLNYLSFIILQRIHPHAHLDPRYDWSHVEFQIDHLFITFYGFT